jgi:1,4-dihydroxy-2-naphthoate polyprenyltransferase
LKALRAPPGEVEGRTSYTQKMSQTIDAVLAVSRAPFLLLSVTLVASGAGAGAYDSGFSWLHTILALLGLVCLHASVNALNEASDMRSGIDLHTARTPVSGGSGTLPAGLMTARQAQAFGLMMAAVGLAVGIYFLARLGWVLLPIVVLGAISVLAYTDVLARMGVGELFAGLGLGALPVMGTAIVQRGELGPAGIAAGIPAFLMTFNLLLLNEFPDEQADTAGGRRNLVLVFGRPAAALVYAIAAIATPLSIAVCVYLDALPMMALAGVVPSIALAAPLRWAFGRPQEPVPLPALRDNVTWNLATNALLAIALFVSSALK